jgi:hypothetical protein
MGGSILELLVAVPSHIIVRRRGDCCAPLGTFCGTATGIANFGVLSAFTSLRRDKRATSNKFPL